MRLRLLAGWLERGLRAGLSHAESRLAVVTVVALIGVAIVAVFTWNSSAEVRNFGLIVAAMIALPLAIWRSRVGERQAEAARRQAETAHREMLDARFQHALEMLASPDLALWLIARRALQRLAAEYPDEYEGQVEEVLDILEQHPIGEDHDDDAPTPD